jgi:hypothetical protein
MNATARLSLLVGALCVRQVLGAPPADTNYDESKVPSYPLPDPLIDLAGEPVRTREQWLDLRRAEILRLYEESVYGAFPAANVELKVTAKDEEVDALGGLATRRQYTLTFSNGTRSHDVALLLYVPSRSGASPAPAFIGLNFGGNHTVHPDPGITVNPAKPTARGAASSRWPLETILTRGFALATIYYGDIDPDISGNVFTDGIHPLFYREGHVEPAAGEWGAIGAWAWGLSRGLDVLEAEPGVDGDRVAVLGHSRLGKTALWAGATDSRFALVISNNSGCGGAALYRRCYGERIHHICRRFSHWFCRNHRAYAEREADLPVDQHMLIALMAPRPVYVASAEKDRWADPRGEFLSAVHASAVYRMLGKEGLPVKEMPPLDQPVHGTIGYHIRSGKHDLTAYDWAQYLDFADAHLREN